MARRRSTGPKRLGFSGSLTLDNAHALGDKLKRALEGEGVKISFGKVKEVDLSFLQLLCSALRTAAAESKAITVDGEGVPPAVSELAETAGVVSPLGRGQDGFWAALTGGSTRGDEHG